MKLNNPLKKIDAKYRIFVIVGIMIVVFILMIAIASLFTSHKMSFDGIEQKMKSAAQSYYADRKEQLPTQDGGSITVTVDTLVKAKKMKTLDELSKVKECTGSVKVLNNNGFYLYLPYLDCGENYQTSTIYSKIVNPSNIVASGNGLYQIGDEYVFRGEYVNNYVTFAGKSWRIIKVNADHSLRLINVDKSEKYVWDNRYNSATGDSDGINNYLVSRIRDRVVDTYNNNKFLNDTERSYIVSHDVCIGKRTINDNSQVECSSLLEDQPLALPRASEIVLASIDPQCTNITSMNCVNYNWMAKLQQEFWTVTADSTSTNYVYRIGRIARKTKASDEAALYVVLHLSGDLSYVSGDGSQDSPYIIK